jgi:hypothetical protein
MKVFIMQISPPSSHCSVGANTILSALFSDTTDVLLSVRDVLQPYTVRRRDKFVPVAEYKAR